jgi:pimeloyl-ACP methyl ester carboxylesterase
MRWLEDPPLPAADLAAIEVPVMILAGELDQVSGTAHSAGNERTADRGSARIPSFDRSPRFQLRKNGAML